MQPISLAIRDRVSAARGADRGRRGGWRLRSLARILAVLLSLLGARPAAAAVLYDNIPPDPLWGDTVSFLIGYYAPDDTYDQFAVGFVPNTDATLESLALLLQHEGAVPASFVLRLFDDDTGLPGTLIEEWTIPVSELPVVLTEPWPETAVSVPGGPVLFAGQTYWLSVATVDPTESGLWGLSDTATAPNAVAYDNTSAGPFYDFGYPDPPTLRAEGTPIANGRSGIEVYQGNVYLGTITPYTGAVDGAANYQYGVLPESGSPIHGPTPTEAEGQLYLYEGSDGLSLTMLFNSHLGGPSGSYGSASWDIAVTGSLANPAVRQADDASTNELVENAAPSDTFAGRWNWYERTDGGVIGELSGTSWTVTIQPNGYGGTFPLTTLRAYDASGSFITLNLDTGAAGTIVLSPAPAPPQSAPALPPAALAALAGALALAGRRSLARAPGSRQPEPPSSV